MVQYLIQLLIFQALFLGVYELFLKKETFFSLNRTYLLVTPFLAALLPFLEIGVLQTYVPFQNMVELPAVFIGKAVIPSAVEGNAGISTALDVTFLGFLKSNWLLLLYSVGVLTSLVLFLRKYLHLKKLMKSACVQKIGKNRVVEIPNSRMACTFFNRIFLGSELSENEKIHILEHERVHVNQKHTWDLLLFEMLRIVLWFNPFIYRQQLQLSLLHEYIADEAVTKTTKKTTYFQNLLNATFQTREVSFINQFFTESLTKKRIKMLQKPKSNRNAKLKYLLVFPLMLLMLTYVACSEDKGINETQEIVPPPPPPPGPPVSPPPPPGPPTQAHKNYLILKDFMEEKGKPFDLTFEEYQKAYAKSKIEISGKPMGDDIQQVPFSVIEQVPIFPGCGNFTSNEAQKMCMSKKIAEFVNANFDTSLSKKLGLKGKQRIQVMFKIDQSGKVVNIKARAPHPELKEEAIRVLNLLPDMIPGKQNGKQVSVLYSLPIIFQVD